MRTRRVSVGLITLYKGHDRRINLEVAESFRGMAKP